MPSNLRWHVIFLTTILMVAYFFGLVMPEVRAWGFSVNPAMNVAWPGYPATYNVSVFLDFNEIMPSWTIQLLVSPPQQGVTVTFSTNNQNPPFTSTMTVQVDDSKPAGIYTLELWAHPSYALFPGPDNKETFLKLNVAMRTDFALSNPSLSPPSPKDGDPVTFSVALTALSSTIPYTQKLSEMVIASVDDVKIGTMFLNYAGPTGTSLIVSTTSPWTATGGAHTIKWHLIIMYDDPNLVLIDPDLTNNEVSLSFSVTTSETTTAIISETTATTTSQTTSTISPSILGYPLESTTMGLALIAICGIAIAAVLMMRRMRKGTGKAKTTTTSAPTKFCLNCGKTMASSAMYCGNCGAKQE